MNVVIYAKSAFLSDRASKLAQELGLKVITESAESYPLVLQLSPERLELISHKKPKLNPIYVDFLHGKLAHRASHGGGKNQLIARACGLKNLVNPIVLDLTAGLGQDGFVLATLGCEVTLIERSPVLFALLRDGLQRAQQAEWFKKLTIRLIHDEGLNYLNTTSTTPNIIYLDPMFPQKTKSAEAKKEMRILKTLVGEDLDAGNLLIAALKVAANRVVVKRPRHAPPLTTTQPDLVYTGKSTRFDVYLCKQIN